MSKMAKRGQLTVRASHVYLYIMQACFHFRRQAFSL